jgi:GT2 family glycosyltransferase
MFDERYFLYVEDVDLSRRVQRHYRAMYCPDATVCHAYGRAAHRTVKAFFYFLRSAVRYFNKWGWFWDGERTQINRRALAEAMSGNERCA